MQLTRPSRRHYSDFITFSPEPSCDCRCHFRGTWDQQPFCAKGTDHRGAMACKKSFPSDPQRSVGLMLDEPEERRKELFSLLQSQTAELPGVEDRRHRQNLLCHYLLFADEPLKSMYLAAQLGVSEGTLMADLNQLTPWFEKYHLQLNRGPDLNFPGRPETARRQASASCLFDQATLRFDPNEERQTDEPVRRGYIRDIDYAIVSKVSAILSDCEKQLRLHLSDNEHLRLLIYLSLTVYRMQKGCFIPEEESIFSSEFHGTGICHRRLHGPPDCASILSCPI